MFFCQKANVPVCPLPMDSEAFGDATGRRAVVAAVTDEGFFGRMEALGAEETAAQEPSE